ncbi:MAG: hypothetical protein HC831_25480 [Chloroflexia bacterium]|nr:hypothetical protein [Chloroflexia bacterium]
MWELVRIKARQEELSQDVITALYNSKETLKQYDKQWLDDNVGAWIKVKNVESAFRKALAYFKSTTVNAENASEVVENLKHMLSTDMSIDFEFASGADFFDAAAHLQTRLARTPSGYPFIDKCLKGGWWKGMLAAFLSGPKAGKCTSYDAEITIRNKKNGGVKRISIGKFHDSFRYNS